MTIVRGPVLIEGKTKVVYAVEGDGRSCLLLSKPQITANDDPAMTKQFESKAVSATTTTCEVFRLLRDAGVPVAFREQVSPKEFVASKCRMLLLECVARRHADGSYLKRYPRYPDGLRHTFDPPCIEFFLKTTRGVCSSVGGDVLLMMPPDPLLTDGRKVEDPFIADICAPNWKLCHPKMPMGGEGNVLGFVSPREVIGSLKPDVLMCLVGRVFLLLEQAWRRLDCRLVDLKLELGLDADNALVVADVITPDEWRLRTADGEELSKQRFRDGDPLGDVEDVYLRVAEMSKRLVAG